MVRIATLACFILGSTIAAAAAETASQTWQEGIHYQRISAPRPTNVRDHRIEVIEFFWYGCPHCYAMEPYILDWLKHKPSDVTFIRLPVSWSIPERLAHARLYFALQRLGRGDLDQAVFDTIHLRNDRLFVPNDTTATLERLCAFAQTHAIAVTDFKRAYADAANDVETSNIRARASKVAGVPSLSVDGQYLATLRTVDGQRDLVSVLDFLISQVRTERTANSNGTSAAHPLRADPHSHASIRKSTSESPPLESPVTRTAR